MEDIRGVRLRKFNFRKIVLGVRVHFHHSFRTGTPTISLGISAVTFFKTIQYLLSRLSFILVNQIRIENFSLNFF